MSTHQEKHQTFSSLHQAGNPLVLVNVWDVGSTRAITAAGAKAIATGSWAVAAAQGYADGEVMPVEEVFTLLRRIIASTDLPVSVDLESGYAGDAAGVGATIATALQMGAIGCNLEDSQPDGGALRDIADQHARLAAARQAAERAGLPFWINARTDLFFQGGGSAHTPALIDQALERAHAYADAGADSLFVPGLTDPDLIATLTGAAPLPINTMADSANPDPVAHAEAGVARISFGPGPYLQAMQGVEQAARALLGS